MNRLARPFVVFVERFYPDPFVFAIGLTVVVYIMALVLTDAGPGEAVVAWGDGLAGLMTFIAQISITIVTAHALAHTGPVRKGLTRLGSLPKSAGMAYAMVAFIAAVASLFAWSFGLVVGALIARQVAMQARERGLKLHYPLLVASAYAGFVIWHMGYSSSAALFVATPGHAMEEQVGIISVTETIFAPWNIATALVALAAVTLTMGMMKPKEGRDEIIEISDAAIDDYQKRMDAIDREVDVDSDALENTDVETPESPDSSRSSETVAKKTTGKAAQSQGPKLHRTLADRLDKTRSLSLFMGLALLVYLVMYFADAGLNLTLDIVNWSFLALGLLLSRSILHYVKLIGNASMAVGQVILQYPFYAGIMGLMAGTGLMAVFADWFTSISTSETLGLWAFLSSGVLNMFVPSGGGQWGIQGPIFLEAAAALGTDPSRVVMGVAYGDQWTNMIQPFFTIPLLAIAGLHVRQIMGYTFIILIVTGVIFSAGILMAGSGM